MRESELISIVLPVYNGERFLAESVESVLQQTYKNFELIIVDDCSNDGTEEIIEHYAKIDSRIKVIRNEINQKLPRSLNIGFHVARGKYYTWTSDDNKYKKDALEKLHGELEKHSEYGLIYTDMEYINEFGEVIGRLCSDVSDIYQYNCVGACFLYRAECKDKLGGYDENRFLVEDYEYWLRISQCYQVGHMDESLYQYRYHKRSLTIRRTREVGEQLLKLKKDYFGYLLAKISGEEKKAFIFEMVVYGADEKFVEENAANDFCENWFFRKREFIENKKIMLFGAGALGLNALDCLGKENIAAFVDNNLEKVGQKIEGKEIVSFLDLKKTYKDYNIVISTDVRKAYYIARQLEQNDMTNYVLFYEMHGKGKDNECEQL